MLPFIKKIFFFITSVSLLYVGPSMAFGPIVVKSMLKTLAEQWAQEAVKQNDGCTALSRAYQGGQPLVAHHLHLCGARMSKRDMICLAVRATMSL